MARCTVSISHVRVRKFFVVEDAADEADAIRQFKQAIDLPAPPPGTISEAEPEGSWATEIKVDWLGAPPPQPVPKSAAELIAAEASGKVLGLDALRAFGLNDRQVDGLRQARLLTTEAIKDYATSGRRFGEIPGLEDSDEQPIKQAVKLARGN